MARCLLELDNVLAAEAWLLGGASRDASAKTLALELLVALEPVFASHGPLTTFVALLDRGLEAPAGDAPVRAVVDALAARSRAHAMLGHKVEAECDATRAIELAVAAQDARSEGRARGALGFARYRIGQLEQAEVECRRALEILEPGQLVRADVLHVLGCVLAGRGDFKAAREFIESALPLYVEAGDVRSLGRTLASLGVISANEGKNDEALRAYDRAIGIATDLADLWTEGLISVHFAQLCQEMGHWADAHRRYERGERALREAGDRNSWAHAVLWRGTLFHEEGRLDDAARCYREALAAMRDVGYRWGEAFALVYFTSVEVARGNAERAEAGYAEAEEIFRSIDARVGHIVLGVHRGYLEAHRGRTAAAEKAIEAAAPLEHESNQIRFALRLVRQVLARGARVLVVGPDARWFEIRGEGRVELAGRDALRLTLLRLVEAHARTPGHPVTSAELVTAGWPHERVLKNAGAARVRVALSTLRKLGLRTMLLSRSAGWMLDPEVVVVTNP
jgi:tetratricopeptide (TPR) repeat protein